MSVEPIQPYLEPLRKSVRVERTPAEAFDVFTARLGQWWPLAQYSISQERAKTCVMEPRVGGDLYEVRDDGERCPWGKVLAWEPPHRVVLSWHPGHEPEVAQEVEVRFTAQGSGTLVELEHREWARLGERAREIREGYAEGWTGVLEVFFAGACRGEEDRK